VAPQTVQPQTNQPQQTYSSPGVTEQRLVPQPGVREYHDSGTNGSGSPLYNRNYPPNSSGTSLQQNPMPRQPAAPLPDSPPKVKLQNIVAIPNPPVAAQIVRNDKNAPEPW